MLKCALHPCTRLDIDLRNYQLPNRLGQKVFRKTLVLNVIVPLTVRIGDDRHTWEPQDFKALELSKVTHWRSTS
jgi:hypothetical protein